jgi:hypothetical protein
MCRAANTIRVKALLEEKVDNPAATSDKRPTFSRRNLTSAQINSVAMEESHENDV